ncbi:UNVERIFIED_CONTAM: cytochrome [Sesamum calycinum]|uniref:Cytochrome n=1 Tax=Sesamum calycinum TaxID=2727403 RepID=A0AAW2Q413_9LAMI
MNLHIAAAAAAAVVVYFWAWQIVNYVWLRPRRVEKWLRAQGWKSNPYRVWYGDLKDVGRMTVAAQSKPISVHHEFLPYVLPYHHHIISKYGKRSLIWHGPTPRIIVTEPDMIKEVLNKHEVFVKVYGNPLNKLLISGLSLHEGQKWAKHRRILNPAFTITKLKLMYISRTAFGITMNRERKFSCSKKEQAQLAVQLSRSVYIPGLRFLPTEKNKRMKEINREVQDVLRGIIQRREEAMRAGEKTGNDMLGILLESNSREVEGNGNREELGISTKEVIDECKLFYFAGQETTSNLLVWTMVMLSIHQNWQTQAREEVLQVFGKSNPDFDGLNQLKKDKEIWGDDAKEFKPERFAQGVANATKGGIAAIPFSLGPRICIGQNFAMVEAKLVLAMILQHFSFELSPCYEHAPVPVLTLQPKYGAKIMFTKI